MNIVVDESIAPLIREQIDVFESSYVGAHISINAYPEMLAINNLLDGTASVAVLYRELTDKESASLKNRTVKPRIFKVAYDGIILVTSNLQDSVIDRDQVEKMLEGTYDGTKSLLFTSVNGQEFRFLRDWSKAEKVSSKFVKESGKASDVLEALTKDLGSIGVISYNQYLNLRDSLQSFDKMRILSVKNEEDGNYYRLSQSSLGDDTYPLRQTVYILNYQPNLGLGLGFSSFLTGDRGQRVVLKSGLMPATMPAREIIIRDGIDNW